jgi:hypothetical protein
MHRDAHPEFVDGCFACRIRSVNIAPSATPTRGGGAEAASINAREDRWAKDMPAYRRLRHNGLQPDRIDGSAELEMRANDRFDITLGRVVPPEEKARVQEGMALAKEMGFE